MLTVIASDGTLTNTGLVTITVNNVDADLTLTKRATSVQSYRDDSSVPATENAIAVPGEALTYTLSFANEGRDLAQGVVITDLIPAALSVVSVESSISITRNEGIPYAWAIGDLPVGAGGVITVSTVVSPDLPLTTLTNTATISATDVTTGESDPGDNVAESVTASCLWAIMVTSAADDGDGTLRRAIANICDGGVITFASDMTIVLSDYLDISNGMTIDGSDHAVTISGGGSVNVIDIYFESALERRPVTLTHLTIADGVASEVAGGITNNTDLTILDSIITNNVGHYGSGGISSSGNLTLLNSHVYSNTTIDSSGGGGIGVGSWDTAPTVIIANSRIYSNTVISTGGGRWPSGGGILNEYGVMTITHSAIYSNTVTHTGSDKATGGGLYNLSGVVTIEHSSISGNSALNDAGGIFNYGVITVENSTISGNSAETAGGILSQYGKTLLLHSTVADNHALGSATDNAGGLVNEDNITVMISTIVAGNSAGGIDLDCFDAFIESDPATEGTGTHDGGHNLVGDGGGCPVDSGTTRTVTPADVFTDVLAPLADNGGPSTGSGQATLTHALVKNSPAIDATHVGGCAVSTDQRGVSREQGVACDIGAYELDQTDLVLSQRFVPGVALPGESVDLVIRFANAGSVLAETVTMTASLPASLTVTGIVSSGVRITDTGGTPYTWQVADVPGNASGVITLTAQIPEVATLYGTVLTSTGSISATGELDASDNTALASLTLGAAPVLTITKSVLPIAAIERGGLLTYTVALRNSGPSTALNTLITDTLPAMLDFESWITQPSGAVVNADVFTWGGEVAAADAITLSYTARHVGGYGDSIVNSAAFSHLSGSGSASTTSSVLGPQAFDFFVLQSEPVVNEGDSLSYQITVFNVGESTASRVTVQDSLGGTFTDSLSLLPGDFVEFSHTVNAADGPDVLTNTVTISNALYGVLTDFFTVTVDNVAPSLNLSRSASSINEGGIFTATLSALSDPGDDTVSGYAIDWGDGLSSTVTALGDIAHTYADDGIYPVRVDVTDEDGTHEGVASTAVTVNNVAPTADAGGPYAVDEGSSVLLNGSGDDVPADPLSYAWDLDGDNSFESAGATTTFDASHLDGPLSRAVTLRVDDGDGGVITDTALITVTTLPPRISLGADQIVAQGETLTVTASVSDPGGDNFNSVIDWGDGITGSLGAGTIVSASRSFAVAGSYTVTVTATDDDGASASASLIVSVRPPELQMSKAVSPVGAIEKGGTLTYTVILSNSGVANALAVVLTDSLPAALDFGEWVDNDGAVVNRDVITWGGDVAAGTAVTFVFTAQHIGNYSDSFTNTVSYHQIAGSASASIRNTVLGPPMLTLAYTVTNATPAEGSTIAYTLTVGNTGESAATGVVISDTVQGQHAAGITLAAGETVSYVYGVTVDDGPLTKVDTATVSSNETATLRETVTVAVQNVAPILDASQSASVIDEGETFTLTLNSVTDPGDDSILGYRLDWGDGVTETVSVTAGQDFTHTYLDGTAIYTPTLVVSDDDGAHGVHAGSVTVNNVAPALSALNNRRVNRADLFDVLVSFSDPGADAHEAVMIWGDGIVEATGIYSDNVSTSYAYTETGSYNVTLSVTDDDGGVGVGSFTVEVIAPELALARTLSTASAQPGQIITYTIAYTNEGTAIATGVRLADLVIGDGLTLLNRSSSGAIITETAVSVEGLRVSFPDLILPESDPPLASEHTVYLPVVGAMTAEPATSPARVAARSVANPAGWQVADLAPGTGGVITVTAQVLGHLSETLTHQGYAFITAETANDNSASATLTLTPPQVQFGQSAVRVAESVGTAQIPVTVDPINPHAPVTVTVQSVDGTASAVRDYAPISSTVIIPAGQPSVMVSVPISDDAEMESDETLRLSLSEALGSSLGNPVTATLTIADDTPDLSVADRTVDEGAGTVGVTVTLSALNEWDTSVIYTGTSGTADAGVDFLAVSGVLTIPAGSRTGVIPLSIVDDLLDEGDETFSVTIGSAVNGSILDSTATVTLVENDVARLSLAKTVTPTLTEPGNVLTYTLVISNSSAATVIDATLTDTLPAGVSFAGWVGNTSGAALSGAQITWNGVVTASTTLTFTFAVSHTGGYGEVITNTASASHRRGTQSAQAAFAVNERSLPTATATTTPTATPTSTADANDYANANDNADDRRRTADRHGNSNIDVHTDGECDRNVRSYTDPHSNDNTNINTDANGDSDINGDDTRDATADDRRQTADRHGDSDIYTHGE